MAAWLGVTPEVAVRAAAAAVVAAMVGAVSVIYDYISFLLNIIYNPV